jgi:hypothetical protein
MSPASHSIGTAPGGRSEPQAGPIFLMSALPDL